jgi:hypothetical protein
MNVETYVYAKEPVLTDIFETPDTSYIIASQADSCQVALLHWLSTMLASGDQNSVELDIKHAKNWLMDNDLACEATLSWPTMYPDLKLHLYVEWLTATHDGGHVYRVIVQPVDGAPEE